MSFKDNHARELLRIDIERDITPGLPAIDRAVAFVRTRGTVTSSELHAVMELDADKLPSKHLADELERGVLIKEGKYWTLGAAALEAGGLMDVVEVEAA